MIPRLGCLFIIVPLVELALLIQMGRWVGVWPTVALVAITGVAGVALVRREGIRTLARIQAETQEGRLPGRALMDGAALLVAGALLTTPGVVTDVLALGLLIPGSRSLLLRWARSRLERAVRRGSVRIWVGGESDERSGGRDAGRGPGGPDDDDPRSGPRPGEIVQE